MKKPDYIDVLVEQYNATGRVAYRYRRSKRVSLNGLNLPEAEAVKRMRGLLKSAIRINTLIKS